MRDPEDEPLVSSPGDKGVNEVVPVYERGCAKITWVGAVCAVYTPLSLFLLWYIGSLADYLNEGKGASYDEWYPYSTEAHVDALQLCNTLLTQVMVQAALNLGRVNATGTVAQMALVLLQTSQTLSQGHCAPWVDPGPAPRTVQFLGVYIATSRDRTALCVYAFVSTVVSEYVNNTGGIYMSNVVQDSTTTEIPFSECTIQVCGLIMNVYLVVSCTFELQLSFVGLVYLGCGVAGRAVFGVYLRHLFMDEKRANKQRALLELERGRRERHRKETQYDDDGNDLSNTTAYPPQSIVMVPLYPVNNPTMGPMPSVPTQLNPGRWSAAKRAPKPLIKPYARFRP